MYGKRENFNFDLDIVIFSVFFFFFFFVGKGVVEWGSGEGGLRHPSPRATSYELYIGLEHLTKLMILMRGTP